LRSRIEKTAKSIYFSKQPHYMTPYTVEPGDQLTKIGNLYSVPWEYLARLNEVDPRKVRAGQKLKVIKGPFAAVVDLNRFELTIQHHGFFVKRYKVGIGKDGTSPIGEFPIKNKLVNPTYYGPDGVIAADDPKNPLGEYWIDIGDSYGIHGTIEPDSIGKADSKGCIRMLNEEAAEVYGFLGIGAKVIIRR
jgi:lipoprotein-anchoring transpeptidase ErfK/SrfK